jgi:metal-sulfur cluster biosynthetic enzyme
MDGLLHHDDRRAAVWRQLDKVTDPELDEALTDLGFIEKVDIAWDGSVDVVFRLPTYWCSSNFAFLMADDIQKSVAALPWVTRVRPLLQDHMTADEVNQGIELGLSFAEVFSRFGAEGTLDALRDKFRRKAFERRQEAVMLALRKAGYEPAALCAMDLATFDAVSLDGLEGGEQKPRYREILIEKGLAKQPGDRAFVSYSGRPVEPQELAGYLSRLRGVRINMEFNSVLCRGLLEARYKALDPQSQELTHDGCGQRCPSACTKQPALS